MMLHTAFLTLATPFLMWGLVAHLVCDWLLQNNYQALNKTSLKHPASWVHAGIHTLIYLFIFPWPVALILGTIHLLIDTRKPLQWWSKIVSQPYEGDIAMHVNIWRDQALHVFFLAVAALVTVWLW